MRACFADNIHRTGACGQAGGAEIRQKKVQDRNVGSGEAHGFRIQGSGVALSPEVGVLIIAPSAAPGVNKACLFAILFSLNTEEFADFFGGHGFAFEQSVAEGVEFFQVLF